MTVKFTFLTYITLALLFILTGIIGLTIATTIFTNSMMIVATTFVTPIIVLTYLFKKLNFK